jgi:hypothetical protein
MLNSMKLTQFAGGIACSTNDEASVTAWNKACIPIQDKGWTLKQSLLNNFLSAMYENRKKCLLTDGYCLTEPCRQASVCTWPNSTVKVGEFPSQTMKHASLNTKATWILLIRRHQKSVLLFYSFMWSRKRQRYLFWFMIKSNIVVPTQKILKFQIIVKLCYWTWSWWIKHFPAAK